jgi:hypothetical protein
MPIAEYEPSTQRNRGAMRDPVRVLETIKRDAITALGGVLSGFWGTIEEQVRLTALAGHDYSAAQDDRMAVTALSQRALELATRYRQSLEREFERWLQAAADEREDKSLSLMSEGELEVHLAGQQTTELLDHQLLHPLELLDERLQALAHALGSKGGSANPVRPGAAVAAFVGLFGPDDLTPGLRPLVFHQFDKRLPHILGDLYGKLNSMLEAAGFGFSLPSDVPAPANARPASSGRIAGQSAGDEGLWAPDGGMVEQAGDGGIEPGAAAGVAIAAGGRAFGDVPEAGRPPRYRDVVREQLRHWRARRASGATGTAGLPAMPGSGRQPAGGDHPRAAGKPHQVLRTEDLLSVAQILQGDDPAPFTLAIAADDARALSRAIREEILGGVRQLGFNPAETHFSIDEEDAIDLIGILFQSLFEANDLLQESRGLYGRLVVPYLKVALTDDSLFNRRSHPARQLLDVLTEACDGNAGETPQDRETLDRAEHAVDRVVEEYQDDQTIFELAASELRDQLDQQRRRAELAEKRAAESIHGRERLQQARRDAVGLVASRMSGRQLTAPVAHFLDRHWRHHLTQVWLREGVESERQRIAIGIGDAMVQVDADAAQARGRAVADQLLALQVPLGECYASCGMDATAARDAMARIISALAIPDAPRSEHAPEPLEDEAESTGDAAYSAGLRIAGGTDTLQFDPTIAMRMRRLRVGQGVRLIDEHGHETAGRIAWVSPMTSRLLIVNRRGVRKLVVSPEELAALVGSGRAVVRSVDAPFDEAMKQLWQHLNEGPERGPGARAAS